MDLKRVAMASLPVVFLVASACTGGSEESVSDGSSTDPTDTAEQVESSEVCDAFRTVVDLNEGIGVATAPLDAILATGGPQADIAEESEEVADALEEGTTTIVEAYERAAATAPDELVDDIETLSSTTLLLVDPLVAIHRDAEQVSDLEAIGEIFETPDVRDAAIEGGEATLRLDEFTTEECGFRLSNS